MSQENSFNLDTGDELLYDIDRMQDEQDPPLQIPELPPLLTTPTQRREAYFNGSLTRK